MTRKQIKKLANELAQLELIHQNSSDKEERLRVEKRILAITGQIMTDPLSLRILSEVDELVQQKLNENNKE